MKFTEDQLRAILYEDYEEGQEPEYTVVSEKILSFDQEKSSVEKEVTIKNIKTKEKYRTILGESPWIGQDEANAEAEWKLIVPKKKK